jgi:hypothetical protein
MALSRASLDGTSAMHEEAVDMEHHSQKNSVHQRLRANSTIMQVRKLLGMLHHRLEPFGG